MDGSGIRRLPLDYPNKASLVRNFSVFIVASLITRLIKPLPSCLWFDAPWCSCIVAVMTDAPFICWFYIHIISKVFGIKITVSCLLSSYFEISNLHLQWNLWDALPFLMASGVVVTATPVPPLTTKIVKQFAWQTLGFSVEYCDMETSLFVKLFVLPIATAPKPLIHQKQTIAYLCTEISHTCCSLCC